jgi:putative endonuclease
MHQVYMLHSEKLNRFYTGYTSNLLNRIEFHQNADNRKFTHNATDWVVFLTIDCESKQQGLQIEKHIKSMKSKVYIENLFKYPEMIEKLKIKFLSDGRSEPR